MHLFCSLLVSLYVVINIVLLFTKIFGCVLINEYVKTYCRNQSADVYPFIKLYLAASSFEHCRKLKHFDYEHGLLSLEMKGCDLTKHTRISLHHECIRSTIVQYKSSATLKSNLLIIVIYNVHVVSYVYTIHYGYWYVLICSTLTLELI